MLVADSAYINGRIYCVIPKYSWAEAVAIKNGRFISVGDYEKVSKHIGPETKVIDLKGKTVLPGLHDMHIHALWAGDKELNECQLPKGSLEDILTKVRQFAQENPEKNWIVGGKWEPKLMSQMTKGQLDAIDRKRPIILFDFSHHNAWVNSKALEIACIDRHTPDPEGGIIHRDENGEPTGLLLEHAAKLVASQIPESTEDELADAAEWGVKHLNSFGITAIKEPKVDMETLHAYQRLIEKNKLHLRICACLMWKCNSKVDVADQFSLIENREKYAYDRLNTNFAKIFIDGVAAFKTGSFIDPYYGEDLKSHHPNDLLLIDPEELKEDLVCLDKNGITVKMHATGDGAVRAGLDAIEAARTHNGFSGLRHEIAHAGYIHPDDMKRFKALDAVVEFSPPLWFPSELHNETKVKVLGKERADNHYAFRSVIETGALTIAGSDWPVSHNANPWPAIEAIVSRKNPYLDYPGTLNPAESIDLESAIEIYTINGAASMYLDQLTGSIQIGKSADMIILDRNIFNIPIGDIRNTQIISTIVEGKEIYSLETDRSLSLGGKHFG